MNNPKADQVFSSKFYYTVRQKTQKKKRAFVKSKINIEILQMLWCYYRLEFIKSLIMSRTSLATDPTGIALSLSLAITANCSSL